MDNKIKIGVIFGGQSAEHQVSLASARNVIKALDSSKYEIFPIEISSTGQWYLEDPASVINASTATGRPDQVTSLLIGQPKGQLVSQLDIKPISQLDVVFPVLHGPMGEDGTIQGLLRLANIPFVGSDVLGSAIVMDKDISKKILRADGLPVTDWLSYHDHERSSIDYEQILEKLGTPLFIKSANMGSSIGTSKVKNKENFEDALDLAFKYDNKIIIEKFVPGREIECSVLGNDQPIASVVGEIKPKDEFYTYEAKYTEGLLEIDIPAQLDNHTAGEVQELAVKAFQSLHCQGLARVDFFLNSDNKVIINELNTIPGFTSTSMYPKLWEASGLPMSALVDRLIELALERHNNRKLTI